MDSLYIVYRKLSLQEESALLIALKHENNLVLFEKEEYISTELQNRPNANKISFDNTFINQVNDEHLERIKALGKYVLNGKTISEHLSYNKSTYWLYLKFSLLHRTSPSIFQIASIEQILEKHKTTTTTVYSGFKELKDYFQEISDLKVITASRKKRKKLSYLFNYTILFLLRAIGGLISLPFKLRKASIHLILTNPYNIQPTLDKDTAEFVNADPHLGYLVNETRNNKSFLLLSQMRAINLKEQHQLQYGRYLSQSKDSRRTLLFESFLLLTLLSPRFYKRRRQLSAQLKGFKQEIRKNDTSDSIIQLILNTMVNSSKMLYQAILREEAAKLLFRLQQLKSITLIDEHSIKNRSLWLPLKELGVNVIGVQHGGISQGNIAYQFIEEDFPYNPIPSLTLIRGDYTKEMLTRKSIYSSEDIQVAGHMRTDVIPLLLSKEVENKSIEKKPTILFATQPVLENHRNIILQQYHDFFTICKLNPDYRFIIKTHPNEQEKDFRIYNSIADKIGTKNYEIRQDHLYSLLAQSDTVVTYYSTVGTEAIYFNKELITLDYNELDLQGYSRDQVCHNVKNQNELQTTINEIVNEKKEISSERKQAFIEKRVFKIDGRSTKRHLESILNLLI